MAGAQAAPGAPGAPTATSRGAALPGNEVLLGLFGAVHLVHSVRNGQERPRLELLGLDHPREPAGGRPFARACVREKLGCLPRSSLPSLSLSLFFIPLILLSLLFTLIFSPLLFQLSFFLLCCLMVIADGHLAIPAGTTRIGPGISLVWKIELSTRSFLGPGEAPRHFSVKKTTTLGFAFCLISQGRWRKPFHKECGLQRIQDFHIRHSASSRASGSYFSPSETA